MPPVIRIPHRQHGARVTQVRRACEVLDSVIGFAAQITPSATRVFAQPPFFNPHLATGHRAFLERRLRGVEKVVQRELALWV